MPIRSLESYLFERKLVNTGSIEILLNATIGIDVDHYLSRIYTYKKEQFLTGIGGIPSSLKDYIQSDLEVFMKFNIKPIFIIAGLDTQLQINRYKTNELSPQEQQHENTWSKLNNKHPYSNIESFRLFIDPLPLRPMINDLIKYFIEINIDYIVAPYDASVQLSYLYHNKFIDTIYGSTDLLLTKVDKFILGMEFQSKDFRFIDKQKVLGDLNLSERQFIDLSLIVGCNFQPKTFPIFPPLPKPNPLRPFPQPSHIKVGLDMIYSFNAYNNSGDMLGYVASLNDPKLLNLYFKGHTAIKFAPVLNKEGYVELYSVEMGKLGLLDDSEYLAGGPESEKKVKVPNDIHGIISQRLPPEIYYYQSLGLLPIQLLESITHGQLDIRPPLESGLSDSYRKLITLKLYGNILDYQYNLITQLLARYYQVKKIEVKFWFKDEVLELNNRLNPPIFKRIELLFSISGSSKDFDLVSFFKNLNGKNTGTGEFIEKSSDIVATSFLRSLYLFEIIDNKTFELGSIGEIFKEFLKTEAVTQEELEQLFLLVLLIKSGALKLTESTSEFPSVPRYFKEFNNVELSSDELNYVNLLSRVISLHRLHIAPINYQGPISRNLLNFRSHIKFISSNLINCIQCCMVDLILRQEKNKFKTNNNDKADWYKLIDQIPFYKDVNNTLLGVVSEIYFEYAAKIAKSGATKEDIIKNTQDHVLNHVYQINNPSFNINVHGVNSVTSEQLLDDFKGGIKFWNKFAKLSEIVWKQDKSLIDDDYYSKIKETDKWLTTLV